MNTSKLASPGLSRRAAGTVLTVLSLSLAPAAARALPINRTFGGFEGTNALIYEDSENRVGAPVIRLYYTPKYSRVDEFSFNVFSNGNVLASFSLSLQQDKALVDGAALLRKQAAAVYGTTVDRVQLLPFPLFESKTTFATDPNLVRSAIIPAPDTPVDGLLHFEVEYTPQGWELFKSRVVAGHGLFANYGGKARLLDIATEAPRDMSIAIPLMLGNLPYCKVIQGGC